MPLIFVIEDDKSSREAVSKFLKLSDYDVQEFQALEGVRELMASNNPDLLILEAKLPDGDGFVFVKEIRQKSDIPVIFTTFRESESDRITGFEVGADDYLVKPVSPRELVLRVKALLKRTLMPPPREKRQSWELKGMVLTTDENSHKAMLDNQLLSLTAAEWKILMYLSSNGEAVVSREQILDRCLEYSFEGYDRTVDTHIKNLRAKLNDPDWIETVRGYGYRFGGQKR